jgi:hypothetical protein
MDHFSIPTGLPGGAGRARDQLAPAPVAMVASVSPQMAMSREHGKVRQISICLVHNEETSASGSPGRIPKARSHPGFGSLRRRGGGAVSAAGGRESPHDGRREEPRERLAVESGSGRALRRDRAGLLLERETAGQRQRARRERTAPGRRVDRRSPASTAAGSGRVRVRARGSARIAFAVWEENAERAGQKAVSGSFLDLELDR